MNIEWYIPLSFIIKKSLNRISNTGLDYRFWEITSNNISLISMITLIFVFYSFHVSLQNIDLSSRTNQIDLIYQIVRDSDEYEESSDEVKKKMIDQIPEFYEDIQGNQNIGKLSFVNRILNENKSVIYAVLVIYIYLVSLKKARLKAIYELIEERNTSNEQSVNK